LSQGNRGNSGYHGIGQPLGRDWPEPKGSKR
jgi:hypothetical protein